LRPVRRGTSPQTDDFADYADAKPYLISRLGSYCSYCERKIITQLAVEHIQAKALPAYAQKIGEWGNFLLACVNCNSTKKDKDVILADVLLPDRDNTFIAFQYTPDGKAQPANGIAAGLANKAKDTLALSGLDKDTLALSGLDKKINAVFDENGKQIAIDRVSQRMEAWLIAEDAKNDVNANPISQAVRKGAVRTAKASGFFSIWMTVFCDDADMLNRLIDAFPGTRGSGCFDANGKPISPAPNPDLLPEGGKI
jgi:uncharacterized protein (TIGR02646 family)